MVSSPLLMLFAASWTIHCLLLQLETVIAVGAVSLVFVGDRVPQMEPMLLLLYLSTFAPPFPPVFLMRSSFFHSSASIGLQLRLAQLL